MNVQKNTRRPPWPNPRYAPDQNKEKRPSAQGQFALGHESSEAGEGARGPAGHALTEVAAGLCRVHHPRDVEVGPVGGGGEVGEEGRGSAGPAPNTRPDVVEVCVAVL